MGLLSNMQEKGLQQMREQARNMTLEQIEEMEKQGTDMSWYRSVWEEMQEEKRRAMDALDLGMLDKYKRVPRSAGDDFVNEVAKFNKLSDKKKLKLEQAPLVYGRVVQAHTSLFAPNPNNKDGGGIMFVYATDDAHCYDEEWLAKTAARISDMKASVVENKPKGILMMLLRLFNLEDNIFVSSYLEKQRVKIAPEDCRNLMGRVCNDRSSFCLKLPETLSDGATAYCATYTLWDQSKLPMAHIPLNKIIPLLLIDQPLGYGGLDDAAQLIPPTYFMK
jgi:hypothetical protein